MRRLICLNNAYVHDDVFSFFVFVLGVLKTNQERLIVKKNQSINQSMI